MLGSFDELEKEIEKFQSNVMASSGLIESLTATAEAIKSQTTIIAEQTAEIEKVSGEVRQNINTVVGDAVQAILSSNVDSVKEITQSLLNHQQEIAAKNGEYLQKCTDFIDQKQQEYMAHLQENKIALDTCKSQIEEAQAKFLEKAEELDSAALKRSVDDLKTDIARKLNVITIVSVLTLVVAVVCFFVK